MSDLGPGEAGVHLLPRSVHSAQLSLNLSGLGALGGESGAEAVEAEIKLEQAV